jgi:hypothetical protein
MSFRSPASGPVFVDGFPAGVNHGIARARAADYLSAQQKGAA